MTTINETGMPRAMLINDLSCIGKCSLSVALPIVSACGVEAVALPTVILSTHTGGFEGFAAHTGYYHIRHVEPREYRLGCRVKR